MTGFNYIVSISFVRLYAKAFLEKTGVTGVEIQFICDNCCKGDHDDCKGAPNGDSTWCDCAHK